MTTHAAPARRGTEEQARFEAALVELWERSVTFNQVLGLKVLSVRPGDVRGTFEMRPDLVGDFGSGRLHGGVTAAVLDAVGGMALMVAIAERHPGDSAEQAIARFARLGTIDLRIDFLRPGLGRRFVASAEVTRLGGRVGSVLMRLANDTGVVLATGAASYIVS
jgi:uncharacterized protein (TIGR00369 family)